MKPLITFLFILTTTFLCVAQQEKQQDSLDWTPVKTLKDLNTREEIK